MRTARLVFSRLGHSSKKRQSLRLEVFAHMAQNTTLQDEVLLVLAGEVEKIARTVPEVVTTRQRGSVLILSDFTGASFDEEAVRAMKEAAVFDKP
jgi:hypothetical protein